MKPLLIHQAGSWCVFVVDQDGVERLLGSFTTERELLMAVGRWLDEQRTLIEAMLRATRA